MNVNGCLYNRQPSTDSQSPPVTHETSYPCSKELQRLPSIVVDNPNTDNECYVPTETDRLLDTPESTDKSVSDNKPEAASFSAIPQEMVPMSDPDEVTVGICDGTTLPETSAPSQHCDTVM